jgi:uncharacterized coiled-coil DUF342 family protein
MKSTSFAMKTALLATLIISGKALAQTLPDEINHPQYLRIYENLEQVLVNKKAEFNNLSDRKAELERSISEMQRDQGDLPARNAELERLISSKREELSRIQNEITGLEGVLNRVIEDLRRIDAVMSQLQRDISEETGHAGQIQNRRAQITQDVANINTRLQQELAEEQQSIKVLNNLNRGLDNDIQKRNEDVKEMQDLARDVERFKRELPTHKNNITAHARVITSKKGQLAEVEGKLPEVRAQITSETSALAQANSTLAPLSTKLAKLKAELATQTPGLTKLEKEISDLKAKIASNKAKINAAGLAGLVTKLKNLENELASTRAQIDSTSAAIVSAKEALKPELAQVTDLMNKIRELERSGANPTEVERLKRELQAVQKRIAPKKLEIVRLEKQHENLLISIAPKEQEVTGLKTQISQAETLVANLEAENKTAADKIDGNQKQIDQIMAANSGLVKEIKELEASMKALQVNRDRIASNLTQLKTQESGLAAQVTTLNKDIKDLEAETKRLTTVVADMEKEITDYPLKNRRLENRIKVYDGQIQDAKLQIVRENKLLARIQQDRVALERQMSGAQNELNRVNGDLAQAQQLIGVLQIKLNQEAQNREALTRYNQDSIRKYDSLKAQRTSAENVISDANQEISVNNQDISTIGQALPRMRSELNTITPKVANAERAMIEAQKKSDDANVLFQNRLSLFERYLSDAQSIGISRANIGTTDGAKDGVLDGRTKAVKLATENAATEAKWVAMRRGYIRGEIAGFDNGFEIGMSSSADASRGLSEGRLAGAKRAKDHANLVLKPEFYVSELTRRLVEDEVSSRLNLTMEIRDELKMMSSSKIVVRNDVPELTQQEIDASARILSALDSMIEQSLAEANQAVSMRSRLADPRGVYTNPGNGENASKPNCSGVYKNVKEFIDECKRTYGERYQGLYEAAHKTSFVSEYGNTFADQIIQTFDSELSLLYPGYLKEASAVGKDVGLTAGKKEIYSQSFARAENETYASNISSEEARVSNEATALVDTYLNTNAGLTLKGEAKLSADGQYGISPGAEVDLKMLLKNVGSKAANTSILRLTEVSSNLSMNNRDVLVPAVGAKGQALVTVMKIKVSEDAKPGSRIVIAGELVHPATHYSASRVEKFKVETIVAVNLSIENVLELDKTPKVSTFGIVKKHDINFTLTPKFEGVDSGYEVSIEEVGSSYARFSDSSLNSGRLGRGKSKKLTFAYKLDKSARGKRITFKMTVKNGGIEVKTTELQINAQ